MARCCEELRVSNFYVSLLVEGLGVAFLVFIGGTVLLRVDVSKSSYIVEASMVLGFTLAVLSQCLKDVSGSHMNPAITIACMLTRRVSLLRAFMYIMFQCGGGMKNLKNWRSSFVTVLCVQFSVFTKQYTFLELVLFDVLLLFLNFFQTIV